MDADCFLNGVVVAVAVSELLNSVAHERSGMTEMLKKVDETACFSQEELLHGFEQEAEEHIGCKEH